jgi:regulator of PEP synthase PpsR (kinase-PPPase family)
LPFINSADRARSIVEYINHVAEQGNRPIIFSTIVNDELRTSLRDCRGRYLDLFDPFVTAIEGELGQKSTHSSNRAHGVADAHKYESRIDAMNYAMEHDDGQSVRHLDRAQLILIAPSRCGKTPTTLYLALQYGLFATNFPLTEEDLEEQALPQTLRPHVAKCYGLTSTPERLHHVRNERRPGSKYASVAQCAYELRQAESLYRRCNIPYINSANMSIEEIAATILQEKRLSRAF